MFFYLTFKNIISCTLHFQRPARQIHSGGLPRARLAKLSQALHISYSITAG